MVTDNPTLEVIELKALDTSFAIRPDQEGSQRRRLMTLIADEAPAQGRGQSEVLRVRNTEGECFALKRLRPLPADAQPFVRKGREAALFEEYRSQLAVSRLQGFPRTYGYGITVDDEPAILMEWVDGETLMEAARTVVPGGPLRSRATVAVGVSILRALASTGALEGTFVHRDISPRNIILKGSAEEIGDSLRAGVADACLIDFGSSLYLRPDEATFTVTEDIWRNGTPEYTPPEMLAPHDRTDITARRSPSIDVYALSSVLYELYAGTTPFRLAERPTVSAYEAKLEGTPAPLVPACEGDGPLVSAIMSGIQAHQADRPTVLELLDQLERWLGQEQAPAFGRTDQPGTDAQDALAAGAHAPAAVDLTPERGTHLHLEGPHAEAGAPAGAAETALPSSREPRSAMTDTEPIVSAGGPEGRTATATAPSGGAGVRPGGRTNGRARVVPSRRAFIGAAALGAAALLGGAVLLTRGFGLMGPVPFGDRSWSDIADTANKIAAATDAEGALAVARAQGLLTDADELRDDLTKHVKLTDGTEADVQVVGFYHDDRSDGRGKAGLTFAFTEPIAAHAMSDEVMADGGWESCDLRGWLATSGLALLPDELARHVLAVDKVTNNEGAAHDASSLTKTADALWLFSILELGGERPRAHFGTGYTYLADIINGEGAQYRLWFQQFVSTNTTNEELERTYDGKPCYWWTRSPSPDVSEEERTVYFNRVGPNGDPFHYAETASSTDGPNTVLPGFCV